MNAGCSRWDALLATGLVDVVGVDLRSRLRKAGGNGDEGEDPLPVALGARS